MFPFLPPPSSHSSPLLKNLLTFVLPGVPLFGSHLFNPLSLRAVRKMAKGNMLLGYSRGKVGDLVFKRQNGQQVVTPRNRNPKNPRTDRQLITRLAFSTAVKTAKQLEGIINHSFQGTSYGTKSIQKFVALAAKQFSTAALAAYDGENQGLAPLLPFSAQGLIQAADGLQVAAGDLSAGKFEAKKYSKDNEHGARVILSPLADLTGNITKAQFEAATGLSCTDQLTFLEVMAVTEDVNTSGEVVFYGASDIVVRRINFKSDLADSDLVMVVPENTSSTGNFVTAALDAERTSPEIVAGDFYIYRTENGQSSPLIFSSMDDVAAKWVKGAAFIASRYENGAWRRSPSTLAYPFPSHQESTQAISQEIYGWNPLAELLDAVRGSEAVSEDWYLNKKKAAL